MNPQVRHAEVPGLARFLIALYRRVLSPVFHASGLGGCKYRPTCSEYAEVAFARYGFFHGGWLTLCRLARCTPFGRGGFDPVP